MKKLMTVFTALATVVVLTFSCTKQARTDLAPNQKVQTSVSKGKGKGKSNLLPAGATVITLTNPAQDSLSWDVPALDPGEVYHITFVEWGVDSNGTWVKTSGVLLFSGTTTPITEYKNGVTNPYSSIPAGTWVVRVTGYKATPNPLAGTQNPDGTYQPDYITSSFKEYQSQLLTVTFN